MDKTDLSRIGAVIGVALKAASGLDLSNPQERDLFVRRIESIKDSDKISPEIYYIMSSLLDVL